MKPASRSLRDLTSILSELDDSILRNESLGPAVFSELLNAQRDLGLLHGDRPTCPFLRPHIITRSKYTEILTAAETLAVAFEKLAVRALADEDIMAVLALSPAELKMARINPGYARLCVTSRLDAFATDA